MKKDIFRKKYTAVTPANQMMVAEMKEQAEKLYMMIERISPSPETTMAQTKLEEVIMWAVKAATAEENQ